MFIIGQFQNALDSLTIDFLITLLVKRQLFPQCHKFNFKQSKKLLARKFFICLRLKLKPPEMKEEEKNNQGVFQKFKTPSCINGAHQTK